MQFGHFEPTVRHAILAISSLYEDFSRGSRITRQICGSSFAIGHYNLAVRRAKSAGNEQLILLLCVLFVCIEYLQGDIDAALQHVRYGILILNGSNCPAWVRDHLVPVFRRLSIIPLFFDGARHMNILPRLEGFHAPISTAFGGISDAQAAIDDLVSQTMYSVVDGCSTQRKRSLSAQLDEWDARIFKFETEVPLSATLDRYAICSMRVKRKVAGIHLDTPQDHTETWFDQHLDTFRSIASLAGDASRLWTTAEKQQNPLRSSFAFEMSLLPLLSFSVFRCRCLKTRLKILACVAHAGPAKEGLLDVGTLYRVGRRIIELEHDISLDDYEETLEHGGDESHSGVTGRMPPEEKRIFAVPVNHELDVFRDQDGRTRYRRQIHFLMRDSEGKVCAREEYFSDDTPREPGLQIPPMRGARYVDTLSF